VPGDFFEALPKGADAIVVKSILHDWSDERSVVVLQNCRRALPANGTLLLVERIMSESRGIGAAHQEQAMSDLNMLRGPGGLERTEKKYRSLLEEAGFRQLALYTAGLFSMIEARAMKV
jgi:hypothetical protein